MKKTVLIFCVIIMFSGCDGVNPPSIDGITDFSFQTVYNPGLTETAYGIISGLIINLEVPAGTGTASMVPTIKLTEGATVAPPSGSCLDFSRAVYFIVTLPDTSTLNYTVNVSEAEE